jgi:hypothetical protein
MADNVAITPGSGAFAACDEVTYSGDSAKVQIVRFVHVEGSEGSKTLTEICDATDGLTVNLGANNDVTVSGSVAVTNAGITTVAGAVAGSEMQVDVVAALPAGDAAIGRVKLTDGTDVADVLDLTNANPLTVAIVDGSGDQITSFGGGTQYTEGATDATITGTALLWEDSADTLVTASAAKPFPVEIVAGAGSGGTAAADDADFTAGTTSGTPAMGVYESTPTSVTDGDLGTIGITQTRALRCAVEGTVTVASHAVTNAGTFVVQVNGDALTALQTLDNAISGSEMQVDVVAALPAGNNNIGDVDVASIAAGDNNIGNVDVVTLPAITGTGTFVVQVDGNALTALQKIDDPVIVDDAAFTPATTSVMMAGFEADETATDSVDEGDGGAARMTLDRKIITTPQPHTAGGLSVFRHLDLDETDREVKATAGQIYGWIITNHATTTRYVKFTNLTAANTTVGSSTVFMTVPVPGNATDDTTLVQNFGGMGVTFDTALTAYCVTGLADNSTDAPGASDVAITIFYK